MLGTKLKAFNILKKHAKLHHWAHPRHVLPLDLGANDTGMFTLGRVIKMHIWDPCTSEPGVLVYTCNLSNSGGWGKSIFSRVGGQPRLHMEPLPHSLCTHRRKVYSLQKQVSALTIDEKDKADWIMATAITGTTWLWFLWRQSFGHCPHWLPWLLKVKLFSKVLKNVACSSGSWHVWNKNVRRSVFGLKVYTGKKPKWSHLGKSSKLLIWDYTACLTF